MKGSPVFLSSIFLSVSQSQSLVTSLLREDARLPVDSYSIGGQRAEDSAIRRTTYNTATVTISNPSIQ